MAEHKAEIIIHPHRIRILQTLVNRPLTTQEISDAMLDIAKSSIYRHLKKMLDAGVIEVSKTRPVRGVLEKVYQLTAAAHLGPEDIATLTPQDHSRLFSTYVITLLQGFTEYVEGADALDFLADRVGYTELLFYATGEEFDVIQAALNQAIVPLLQNGPGEGRRRRKLATITHPVHEIDINGVDNEPQT